jgi:GNAT superfamily N-acetyltransferase
MTYAMDEVQIRLAGSDDAELLFGMQRASALSAFGHIFPPDEYPFPDDAERQRWAELVASNDAVILVAEHQREPAGLAVIRHDELQRFFVVPEKWGSGVADALHDAVLETLREWGESKSRLWVMEENRRARRFYERNGWRPDGRTRTGSFPPYPPTVGYSRDL